MILKKLIVGPLGTNCYIFGSNNEIVVIDPGGDANTIIKEIEGFQAENNAKPIAILLTHCHFDHTIGVGKISRHYKIPVMFSKKESNSGGMSSNKKADKWLNEGDVIEIDDTIFLRVLETPGHSPGSLCYYSKEVKEINGKEIDGIIFTGDLLFRGSIGRSDMSGGNPQQLFSSIKNKLMYNTELTDNFLALPGHMENTSIGEERRLNPYKNYFLEGE